MRSLLTAICLLTLYPAIQAQESPPPTPPQPGHEHRRPPPPVLLDFGYNWRVQGHLHGWHDVDALVRIPLGGAFDLPRPFNPWQFGLRTFYSHGYGESAESRRIGVMGVGAWGVDWFTDGPEFTSISLGRGSFLSRARPCSRLAR